MRILWQEGINFSRTSDLAYYLWTIKWSPSPTFFRECSYKLLESRRVQGRAVRNSHAALKIIRLHLEDFLLLRIPSEPQVKFSIWCAQLSRRSPWHKCTSTWRDREPFQMNIDVWDWTWTTHKTCEEYFADNPRTRQLWDSARMFLSGLCSNFYRMQTLTRRTKM